LHELTHNHTHISHSSQNVQQENADVVMNLKSNVASDYHDQGTGSTYSNNQNSGCYRSPVESGTIITRLLHFASID
jgi:hypothetical protein